MAMPSSTQPSHTVPILSTTRPVGVRAAVWIARSAHGQTARIDQQNAAQRHEPVQETRRQLHRRGTGRDHHDAERDRRPAQAHGGERQAEPAEEDDDERDAEIDEVIIEAEPGARADIDGAKADNEDAESGGDEDGESRVLQHPG